MIEYVVDCKLIYWGEAGWMYAGTYDTLKEAKQAITEWEAENPGRQDYRIWKNELVKAYLASED